MLSHLPIHPFTGLQALGFTPRGKMIWPVMGGSQPQGEPQNQPPAPPAQPQQQQPPSAPDKGFPDNTPLEQMSTEQREAYWKHYSRKHEADAKAFTALGLTPEQVQEMVTRNEELEASQLSASDKAINDAKKAGKAESDAEWKPKYLAAELKSAAAQFFPGEPEKMEAFMSTSSAAAFVNASGEIDTDKVTSHLTTLFGPPRGARPNGQQAPNWGQHGGQPPPTTPGEGGRAEAERRRQARNKTLT